MKRFFSGNTRANAGCCDCLFMCVIRSVAFGAESESLAALRSTLRSSMDEHYLAAIASRAISGRGRSFKAHSIENYTAKALLLDGSDFTNCVLSNVTFARSSLSDCVFSGAALQVNRLSPHARLAACCRFASYNALGH
jgi:hypothetical protein